MAISKCYAVVPMRHWFRIYEETFHATSPISLVPVRNAEIVESAWNKCGSTFDGKRIHLLFGAPEEFCLRIVLHITIATS